VAVCGPCSHCARDREHQRVRPRRFSWGDGQAPGKGAGPAPPCVCPAPTPPTPCSTAPGARVMLCCPRACPEPPKTRGKVLLGVLRVQPRPQPPPIQGCLGGHISKGTLSSSCPISGALRLHPTSDTSLQALLEPKQKHVNTLPVAWLATTQQRSVAPPSPTSAPSLGRVSKWELEAGGGGCGCRTGRWGWDAAARGSGGLCLRSAEVRLANRCPAGAGPGSRRGRTWGKTGGASAGTRQHGCLCAEPPNCPQPMETCPRTSSRT